MAATRSKQIFAALIISLVVAGSPFARQESANPPIAILGIPEETEALAAQLADKKEVKVQGLAFLDGRLRGKRVVLGRIGFGKVNAALAATLIIEHFKPEGVIFTGAAGALNPDLNLGDIVIGTQTTQHDFGMLSDKSPGSPTGFAHWRTRNPVTNEKNPLFFTAGDRLLRAAREAGRLVKLEKVAPELEEPKVIEGVIATGDLFVSEKSKNYELGKHLDADAVEMEGAAVAQVSWQFGVPCLIVRSISDTASGSSLVDYYKFVKIAARNSSSLVAETITQLDKLGPAPPEPPAAAAQSWKIAFELAFGEDSPYGSEFPDLYKLPYEVNLAITKEVLDQIVGVALKEVGAKQVRLSYSPGGYRDFPVVPSAQLEVEATDAATQDLMNVVGYLAQQTTVIASKRIEPGNRRALQIVEKSGASLANPKTVEEFWHRLSEAAPKLHPGFSSVETGGRPGLYIIDSDGDWLAKDFPKFRLAVTRLSKEFGITADFMDFPVEYVELGNNWKLDAKGEQYLRRFEEKGMSGLRRRLEAEYQPRVRTWIRKAFEKHGPEALKLHDRREKRIELLLRPRLNTLSVSPANRLERGPRQ